MTEEEQDTVTITCEVCSLVFGLPRNVTLTRGSRPCGWEH